METGGVVFLPNVRFGITIPDPAGWAAPRDGRAKNVSFNPATGVLKGAPDDQAAQAWLTTALSAYANWALELVRQQLPAYAPHLTLGKTSFRPRPAEVAISPRKDDRRLHVDAFPSQPVQGRRILRVFRNVSPWGEARVWQTGEAFVDHAARFLPASRRPAAGLPWLLQSLGLTKGRRTAYDALMLALHDAAKAADAYQAEAARKTLVFPPDTTWLVFTDSVPHAALRGRFALEQTFFLPVEAMADPDASPLRILERMTGRRLT